MLGQAPGGKERFMTERDRRTGSGGTGDNVRDEFEEATEQDKDTSREAVEEEEKAGGTGGVKDNVRDEFEESQRR
jgi:hypothetical protein